MSILKDAIKSVDPTPDKTKELTLSVNLLFELADQKKSLQEEWLKNYIRTAGTKDNPSIPITNTLAWHSETRAYVKKDSTDMVKNVSKALKQFISNDMINGVAGLLSSGINSILGSGMGVQSEMHSYYIIVDGLSIIRLDVTAWQRHIEATGITKHIENAMTFTAVKSSVDVNKISFNTFLYAYQYQLENLKIETSELKKYLLEAKDVFELLKEKNATSEVENLGSGFTSPSTITMIE
jgi:hypothetical protein